MSSGIQTTAVVPSSLAEQEAIVERGLSSFVDVGNALMRIRDEELYREVGFDGFVAYLESKPWGIDVRRAYKQIDASAVVSYLPNLANEAQAVELAPLLRKATPDVVRQVYAEVVEESEGRPTAALIRDKVAEILPSRGSTNGGQIDPAVIHDAMALLDAFNKLAPRITPEVLGRLSQSVCKRYEARAAVAESHLASQRAELRPRLDSLTPTRRA